MTMAGIVAESVFADKLDRDVRDKLRQAMLVACKGNAKRHGDWHGDDMWPSYSNASWSRTTQASLSLPLSRGISAASAPRLLETYWGMRSFAGNQT